MALTDEITPQIKPGDDFYLHVNQKWLEANPIPDDRSRWGSFSVLGEENTVRLRALLEKEDQAGDHANLRKLRQFYRAAMDEEAIEAGGLAPIQPIFDEIAGLEDFAKLKNFIADWQSRGLGLIWQPYLSIDDKNSQRYMAQIYQDGLGLPDRDYYLESGEQFETTRAKYQEFLAATFGLLEMDNAPARAGRVFELEAELAKISSTAVERRDPEKMYNLYEATRLDVEFPELSPWAGYMEAVGFGSPEKIVIAQPAFLKGALALLKSQPTQAWKDYLTIHTLLPVMNKLPRKFADLHFEFYGKVLNGAKEQEPRYRRVINLVMNLLPQPTGQLFVSAHFDESAKEAIYNLVEHITAAFADRIKQLDWMSEPTKAKALEKLGTFLPLLGYPDKWRDFEKLEIGDNYAANFLKVAEFEWRYEMGRLEGPVDRKEWLMSPALVNAYYWSNTNGITFPAGILQPPFFDAGGDFAANYGGIGVVIGHELTHGFDDQGSKFDKDGNLKSWWTDKDRQKFEAAASRLADQFDQFEIDGRKVNGRLTLGENIADLGGVMIALDAMQREIKKTGKNEAVDGFTPEQRFFMNYARVWRQNIRPELALQFLVSDPHSPSQYRVNGILPNVDEFYSSFKVQEANKLFRKETERVRIW